MTLTRCHGLLALLAVLVPAAARAQDEAPAGSLTLVSRPPGVAVRISGDQEITGRTPFTLERGLVGRYQVRSIEPGYEVWRRSIILDGASQDTLWMTLRRQTALKGALRSLIVPGSGQLYSGRPAAAWVYFVAGVGAGSALVWTNLEYDKRLDELNRATTNPERRRAAQLAEDAYQDRQLMLGVTAGVWALNVLDAVIFFPRRRTPAVTVGMGGVPGSHGTSGVTVVARMGF